MFEAKPEVDLSQKKVAILGCGSVGGLASWCRGSAGVGTLLLADRDRLAADNLRRHVCGLSDVGREKPLAVAGFLRDRLAALGIAVQCLDVLEDPQRLRELVAGADMVLAALDQEGPKHLLDAICWELGRAVVYVGIYGSGWGAEVILVDPAGKTPCYGCAARNLGRAGIAMGPQESSPAYSQPLTVVGRPGWARANLTSIMPAAALAARVALAWLAKQNGQPTLLDELAWKNATAWRLGFREVSDLGLKPWLLKPIQIEGMGDCPTCGVPRQPFSGEDFTSLLRFEEP